MKLGAYDVGFSDRPTAGIGRLVDGRIDLKRITGGEEAFRRLEAHQPYDVIAIDGPITPFQHDANLVRKVESFFQRGAFQRRCKCAASHVKGTGQQLRQAAALAADVLSPSAPNTGDESHPLIRKGRLVEAFPNAFLGVCVTEDAFAQMPRLRRGKKFDWLYGQWQKDGIAERLPLNSAPTVSLFSEKMQKTHDHEERAALVCLMTAACVADGSFTAVGDKAGGWFFLPPWSLWADWAKEEASRQAERFSQCGQNLEIINRAST